jgi:multidrug efflux pump subunit AcrB
MISHFFIDRPIFAAVVSIALITSGRRRGRRLAKLPIAQYPNR